MTWLAFLLVPAWRQWQAREPTMWDMLALYYTVWILILVKELR